MKGLSWSQNEWKNQCVHIVIGGIAHFITWCFFGSLLLSNISSGVIAVLIEIYQYFKNDNRELKLADRIRDICFYQIYSIVATGYYYYINGM